MNHIGSNFKILNSESIKLTTRHYVKHTAIYSEKIK